MQLDIGQKVGDYEILERIGAGGMGRVYRVRNVISHRVEALKALDPALLAEPDFTSRFSAEIRTLAAFDHPNIAQLRTAFAYEGEQFMVMEFVEGSALDAVAQRGAMPAAEAVPIILQVLAALSYAHERGVIHRDIKPANIMITLSGAVKLMDFGIAKSASENQLTQPGSTFGSFYYMSPEQVRGGPVDARSDIYALGVVFYELLAGCRPFQADNTFELLNQHLNDTPRPPAEINPNVPQALSDLILMAVAKDPAGRFQSADAFAKALRSVSAAAIATKPFQPANTAATTVQPKTAVPNAPPPPVRKPNRTLWVVAGALAVVVVFAAALTLAPRYFRSTAAVRKQEPAQSAPVAASSPKPVSDQATQPAVTSAASPAVNHSPVDSPSATPRAAAAPEAKAPVVDPLAPPDTSQRVTQPLKPAEPAKRARNTFPPISPPQRATAAVDPPPPEVQPPPSAGTSDASAQEMEQAQDDLVKLNARASAVSASVERLQQQQAADGLGLRQDMAGAYARMNAYLHSADADVVDKNVTALRRHMDLAEKELSTLEKFFNK